MPTTAAAETAPARCAGASAPMKIVATRICVGQRPLQSEKLLVMMAIRRSRGLSIHARRYHAGGVAPEPHAHGERLLAVGAGRPEQRVEVEGDPRQVAESPPAE